jgi:hypothetical protein
MLECALILLDNIMIDVVLPVNSFKVASVKPSAVGWAATPPPGPKLVGSARWQAPSQILYEINRPYQSGRR